MHDFSLRGIRLQGFRRKVITGIPAFNPFRMLSEAQTESQSYKYDSGHLTLIRLTICGLNRPIFPLNFFHIIKNCLLNIFRPSSSFQSHLILFVAGGHVDPLAKNVDLLLFLILQVMAFHDFQGNNKINILTKFGVHSTFRSILVELHS